MKQEQTTILDEKLWCKVMEDYVITAELGHLALDQKKHKEELRFHFNKLLSFIQSEIDLALAERDKEIVEIIDGYSISDWSDEQAFYDALGEIKNLITKKK